MTNAPRTQITTAQHIFPSSCLRHFAGRGGKLQVRLLRTGLVEHHGPYSPRFTTTRAWDQRTEAKVMQHIETEFGRVIAPIRKGQAHALLPEQHRAVAALYALWMLRAHRASNPIPELQLNGRWAATEHRSAADVDEMEAHGIITIKPGGFVIGRQMAGPQLQLDLDRACLELADIKWGVLRVAEGHGEFCVPDTPGRVLYLPITPAVALAGGWADGMVDREAVLSFNTAAVVHAREFVAARDLAACPWLPTIGSSSPG